MIDVQRLYEFGTEVVNENIGIIKSHVVIDESEVTEILREFRGEENNHILIIVVPSYNSENSSDIDSVSFTNYMQFLILEKYSRKKTANNLDWVQLYRRTQNTTNQFLDYLLEGILGDNEVCSVFNQLNSKTIQIDPVKGQSDCYGWNITFAVD